MAIPLKKVMFCRALGGVFGIAAQASKPASTLLR